MLRRAIFLFLLALVALLPACTVYGGHSMSDHWANATGGESLERSFWEDVKTTNWDQLEGHMAVNYVAVTPQGSFDRPKALDQLRHLEVKEYSLANVQTELHGNAFVVTYDLTLEGKGDDQPLSPAPVRMMTVWQQQKRGWVAIARSELGKFSSQ